MSKKIHCKRAQFCLNKVILSVATRDCVNSEDKVFDSFISTLRRGKSEFISRLMSFSSAIGARVPRNSRKVEIIHHDRVYSYIIDSSTTRSSRETFRMKRNQKRK